MTLNELKYIVAVAKERHFRKASETCFVSQPTLSIAIKKFEEEIGVELFERNKTEILVTPIGKQIIHIADEILQKTQIIKQLAKEDQGDHTGEIKLGAIYTIAPYLLPKLIPMFHKLANKTPIILQENYTHLLMEKLINGDLDLVILSLPFEHKNIETQVIYTEPFVVALPKNHILHNNEKISIKEIKKETLLMLGEGHCFRNQVIDAFNHQEQINFQTNKLQKTLEGSSLETIRYMVASGAGITILPCSSVQSYDEELLSIKPIDPPIPPRKVALAWRKTFPRKQLLKTMINALQKIQIPCTIKQN
ncbi:hydrogen peroxide-inducible genes activator [Thiomicrospira microaerophila]|uniref:hydrogen peroxide-inducible genes activator n=1 Tax=Thiomicrospira microaerophila TaxID=406020 RepID=UPI0005CA1CC9|nr:hydrogen peroxide-inducible genes activator [Thiomicrospira microaerophila]